MKAEEAKKYVEERWRASVAPLQIDPAQVDQLLEEIIHAYSQPARHYHNLVHIASLLKLSDRYADHLSDKPVVDFAIFYHDIVYDVPGNDNEGESAAVAEKRLGKLNVQEEKIKEVKAFIEATKTHELSEVRNIEDLKYFLDFDLSILAADWDEYLIYTKNIRKEYSIYPDILYYGGRGSFVKTTLQKEHVFHTDLFRSVFENKARQNLQRELEQEIG